MNKEWKTEQSQGDLTSSRKYEDRVLKEEYRKMRLKIGQYARIRPVPLLKGSKAGCWLMPVHVLYHARGRLNHPRNHDKKRKCLIDDAYAFVKGRYPSLLYSKSNRTGIRLLADILACGWVIAEEEEGPKLKLFIEKAYSGKNGGNPTLGYRVYETSKTGYAGLDSSADDPQCGCMLRIERIVHEGTTMFPVIREPGWKNIDELFSLLTKEDQEALCNIEDVLLPTSEDEELKVIEEILPSEVFEHFLKSHCN
jgi:hypothetical protein